CDGYRHPCHAGRAAGVSFPLSLSPNAEQRSRGACRRRGIGDDDDSLSTCAAGRRKRRAGKAAGAATATVETARASLARRACLRDLAAATACTTTRAVRTVPLVAGAAIASDIP